MKCLPHYQHSFSLGRSPGHCSRTYEWSYLLVKFLRLAILAAQDNTPLGEHLRKHTKPCKVPVSDHNLLLASPYSACVCNRVTTLSECSAPTDVWKRHCGRLPQRKVIRRKLTLRRNAGREHRLVLISAACDSSVGQPTQVSAVSIGLGKCPQRHRPCSNPPVRKSRPKFSIPPAHVDPSRNDSKEEDRDMNANCNGKGAKA